MLSFWWRIFFVPLGYEEHLWASDIRIHYDEHVPNKKMLFGELRYGKFRYSSSLKLIFQHYRELSCKKFGVVSINDWILHFFVSSSPLETGFSLPSDPFRIGAKSMSIQDFDPPLDLKLHRRVFLLAFLSYWLCYFVVSQKYSNWIRPKVFIMTETLSEQIWVSLAPTALSSLFRSLRETYTSDSHGSKDALLPLHYLFGWFII